MFLWAKYGTQTDIRFAIVKRGVVDLAATADWTPATGDTKISKDGGNYANTTNNPAAVGGTGSVGWKITVSATELQAAEVNIQIVDSATKAVEDQFLTIYTYGNASAKIQPDLSDIVRMGLTAMPNVASGSAGAIVTSGTGTAQLATTSGNVALTSTGNTAVVTELMGTTTENNGTLTFKGLMRLVSTVMFGRTSISGSTVTFKTADNVKTRVTTVTDSSNQRTTVTLDATD